MPQVPGIVAMPTTLANAVLGALPDRSLPVVGPDRWAALVPMYEEEEGAGRALASLLAQTVPLDQVIVSINGGRDRTAEVVAATLVDHGYVAVDRGSWDPLGVPRTHWRRPEGGPDVVVVEHDAPTAKAESLNLAVAAGLVDAQRILVVDGDTELDAGFVAAAQGGCYRLRRDRRGGPPRWVLEDVALVSGAVTSARPARQARTARFVSAARDAEYAFAVAIRRGQTTRVGHGATFGASRLFTVVGCGFVARRDAFPIPDDTLTEDHDFTVQELARGASERTVDVADLHRQGFRVVVDGRPRPLREVVPQETLVVRRAPEARFEPAATMTTEDPRHLGGYLVQVERWVGGALDVVAKRAGTRRRRRDLPPNARFALLAAQLENLAGLLLLLALPAALGLTLPWAGGAGVARKALAYLAADVAVSGALVFLGAWLHARARGRPGSAALVGALTRTARGLLPLLLLRPVNALAYATSLARALPRLARWSRRERATATVWDRPAAAPRGVRGRTVAVGFGMAAVAAAGFVAAAWPGWSADPAGREAWRAVRQVEAVELEEVARLPLAPTRTPAQAQRSVGAAAPTWTGYCPPAAVARASEPRRLSSPESYAPLGAWALMTLARLAPLADVLEEAASAYDVPAVLLLQVLLNESYLDPLAEGPTDDLGLAQMTPDALALLHAISTDPTSPYANAALFARPYNVFDPEFSVCAGAAKLAWARGAAGGSDDEVAYARYINPIDGVVDAEVSTRHRPLVDAFVRVGGMAHTLAATFEAYRSDPSSVAPREAALLDVADAVARGDLSVEAAYRVVHEVALDHAIDDAAFFERVLIELYGERQAVVRVDGAWARVP
jgi:cellulose synthase/poly-beta-1,6-N-acetylglucosamine synthase-like glycosyltransferase